MKRVVMRLSVAMSLVLVTAAATPAVYPAPEKPLAKNIIIMIADGSGYNQNDAATMYQYGVTGVQPWDAFPFRFAVSTYSADGWGYDPALAWSDYDYVKTGWTDSAAAATAMATGVKTYDAAIGVDPNGNPVPNVLEKAEGQGRATGVVTTVPVSHATPGGFVAHNVFRDNYAQIAQEMVLESAADVIMGAGNPWFDEDGKPVATPAYDYAGGQATWDALVAGTAGGDADGDGDADPWTLIQARSEFQALATGPTPARVIGVAQVHSTLQEFRSGDGLAAPYVVPLNEWVPTLAEMSMAALNVLDEDPDGFFLMVEGGAVDWAGHYNHPGRLIEARIDFNHAVEAVLGWIERNSNWGETLLIVTSDHETGYLWGPGTGPDGWLQLVNNGAAQQPGMQFDGPNHTNSLVPLWAKGNAGHLFRRFAVNSDPLRGPYIDNTNIATVMFRALEPAAE